MSRDVESEDIEPKDIESIAPSNWMKFFLSLIILLILCYVGYCYGIMHIPKEFPFYHFQADWFLLFVSILAILGAFWAVLARIDADKAFTQSKKTYDALQNTFKFKQIYDRKKLRYIYDYIGKENVTVTLFLNFPMVGLLEPDVQFVKKVREAFTTILYPKLDSLMENFPDTFKLNLACYTESYAKTFLKDLKWEEDVRRLESFYSLVNRLASKYGKEKFNSFYFDKDIGLRIALVNPNIRKEEGKALVWTVSDFKPSAPSKFEAVSFQTMDKNFIETLNEMFHNFKEKADHDECITFYKNPPSKVQTA